MGQLGTGADEGHVSAEDVPELRKFVELVAAKESADGSDADIPADSDAGVIALLRAHGTKLIERELVACAAHATLAEKNGTRGAAANEERREKHEREEDDQGNDSDEKIEGAAERGERPRAGVDRGGWRSVDARALGRNGSNRFWNTIYGSRANCTGSGVSGVRRKHIIK